MKSLTVSVFYPVWCWIQNPEEKFIYASYDASLSERDARRMRDIITSDWFILRWGSLLPSHALRQVRNFSNRAHGFRFSTSVEGKMTGRHADQLWVDDDQAAGHDQCGLHAQDVGQMRYVVPIDDVQSHGRSVDDRARFDDAEAP
jgi:hypothetical protein